VAVETTGAARGFTQGQTEGKAGGGPGAMGKCGGVNRVRELRA
jgi:hypothetical protein